MIVFYSVSVRDWSHLVSGYSTCKHLKQCSFNNSYDFLLYAQFPPTEFLDFWVSLLSRLSKCHCIIITASKYAFPSVPVTWTKRKKTSDYFKWWRNMLHSEPQTYVITSETLQIFVPLSDLSNISDFGRLHSLKKDLLKKGQKRAAIFSWRLQLRYCKIYQKTTSLI